MGLESKPFDMDPAFIQAPEHRPSAISHQFAEGVPIIDLSPLLSPDSKKSNLLSIEFIDPATLSTLVDKIKHGCKDWGFFQVINHGVPIELRRAVEEVSIKFFGFPLPEKRKVRRDEENTMGYYDEENTKNVRDWKEVFDFSVRSPIVIPELEGDSIKSVTTLANQWPENLPEMRSVCKAYAQATQKLAVRLLELISLSLGLPVSRLNAFFKDQTSFIRLNHYPPCPSPNEALGVGRHKDFGALTVLAQDDVGGLEVKRKDGEWVAVKPVPNSYIINIGDIIQVWSNDEYESAEHRVVVNSKRERFSMPFFYIPSACEFIEPLEEKMSEKNPPNYLPYNWGHFYISRKLSNFKKRNTENLQIQHFRASKLNA
ncbi:probable 2-oxoglutarate-dependent dioxygenase At5g05600 [Amborella trichopoda]|nr:probable 2-oxoglutarate-dependent dioxygenase At5g05600 [Amborella trichopoda]|eukprot:XP_006856246.2 probable 2-oxoglutarate-dependent dioxygenase At5g05600 [Amborella trichopoda]